MLTDPDDFRNVDFDLMDTLTENQKFGSAVMGVRDAAFRSGWYHAMKKRDDLDQANRTAWPFLLVTVAALSGAIGGAVLWGTIARNGWLQIIGYCAP